ncbi:serine/threonine-protein kinase Sgk2 [Trichoderma compactum]
MTQLTQDERNAVEQNPLGDSLSTIREALREAEPNAPDEAESNAPDEPSSPNGSAASPERPRDVEYRHLRPLSQLVIEQAPDADIWTAVFVLLEEIHRSTPPPVNPTSPSTPISHSSASQQDSEQTRQMIEEGVFQEIRHCTHCAVGGFHEKYFEGKTWNGRAKRVWEAAKSHYSADDERWKRLPDAATEDEVCDWWLGLQQEMSPNERSVYVRSTQNNRVGDAETQRQLDLFVKKEKRVSPAKHDWKYVLVIGELKKSDRKDKALWLQISNAVRNVFTSMETWVFDCSGPYSGAAFNVHEEPEKFIQVLCGYQMMSDAELGLDPMIKERGDKLFISMPRAVVCRGTCCFLAKPTGADEFDRVVKFSWVPNVRPPEADLLNKANNRGVKGLAKVVGYHEVTSISKLRKDLVFSVPHKFRERSAHTSFSQSQPPQSFAGFRSLSLANSGLGKRKSVGGGSQASKRSRSSSQPGKAAHKEDGIAPAVQEPEGAGLARQGQDPLYNDRTFRAMATSPAGQTISQFKSVTKLLEGLREGIRRTHIATTLRHSSILIWLCARRGWALAGAPQRTFEDSLLRHWYTGSYRDIAQRKRGDMDRNGLEMILAEFPPTFDRAKPLCRRIRDVLFPYRDGH